MGPRAVRDVNAKCSFELPVGKSQHNHLFMAIGGGKFNPEQNVFPKLRRQKCRVFVKTKELQGSCNL
jgi:hypothetical protein